MYRLSEKQQKIMDKAREISDKFIGPRAAQVDKDGTYPMESMKALATEGFWGLNIAPEFGGMGQGLRVMCAVLDEIAQRCASTAMCYKMHLSGQAAYGAAVNKPRDVLRAAAEGKHLTTLAWSEFGSRGHFWAPVSQEKRRNGKIVLNASKSMITTANDADSYVVTTRWSEAETPVDNMLYMVLKQDEGVSISGKWDGLGMRGNDSAPLTLRDVTIGEDRALCGPGKGLDMMLNVVLPVFALGNAAISIGIAEAAVKATHHHITTGRFQYLNQSLADVPLERARLAQIRLETDRARAHLAAALDSVENPGPATMLLVLESKAAAAETAVRVTDIALLASGGRGFSRNLSGNLGIERNFRDARAAQVMGPSSDMIHELIGRALCGMELFS
ncbi:MAG: acyl-CoA/acyl-ACP dehydrogenase [Chloroflexi bacterium]|nr:acyl-CoA/acyl-ACP dehydrogenase [Chloroflexota bacterium]